MKTPPCNTTRYASDGLGSVGYCECLVYTKTDRRTGTWIFGTSSPSPSETFVTPKIARTTGSATFSHSIANSSSMDFLLAFGTPARESSSGSEKSGEWSPDRGPLIEVCTLNSLWRFCKEEGVIGRSRIRSVESTRMYAKHLKRCCSRITTGPSLAAILSSSYDAGRPKVSKPGIPRISSKTRFLLSKSCQGCVPISYVSFSIA